MFKRNWRRFFADYGLIAILPVAFLLCAIAYFSYSNSHEIERNKARAAHVGSAASKCVNSDSWVSFAQCIVEANPAAYEQSAEYHDLKAQQEMAKWALLMLIVTSVGVVYVAATLWEANQTAIHAQAMLEQQRLADERTLRPYIEVKALADAHSRTVRFLAVNVGQTPARDLRIITDLTILRSKEAAISDSLPEFPFAWRDGSGLFIAPSAEASNSTRALTTEEHARNCGDWAVASVHVSYRDFFTTSEPRDVHQRFLVNIGEWKSASIAECKPLVRDALAT